MQIEHMTYSQKEYMDHFRLPYFPRNHRTPTTRQQAEAIIRAAQERAGLWGEDAKKAQMAKYQKDVSITFRSSYDRNRGNKGLNK